MLYTGCVDLKVFLSLAKKEKENNFKIQRRKTK